MDDDDAVDPPGAAPSIRVLIVDDHQAMATSLAQVLDGQPGLSVVGVAGTIGEASRMMRTGEPDVVLLDYRLPDGDGVKAIPSLLSLRPSANVVVLTASASDTVLVSAIEAGASGFLSKARGIEELTSAVHAAASGESVISPELLARLLPRLHRGGGGGPHELTPRELEVLALLADGRTNGAIAEELSVSVNTVRNHVSSLSLKLGAHSKLEALSIAVREGLLPDA